MRTMTNFRIVLVLLVLLDVMIAGEIHAQIMDVDNDYPSGLEASFEKTIEGNPLNDGDDIYSLRGSYRFFYGEAGVEAGLAYAEPTSDFVRARGTGAKLLLLDFSGVWYANYKNLNRIGSKSILSSRIKPELIVFGGPGLASLTIDNPLPGADASEYFFTMNAGVGAKIHWLITDREKRLDHHTSRFYLRTEARARWFAGANGEIDWGFGVALGYELGDRPSLLSLRLKVDDGCKRTEQYLSQEAEPALASEKRSMETSDEVYEELTEYRRRLEVLKARVVVCGPRCEQSRACLEDNIQKVNETLTKLRSGHESAG